MKTINSKRKLIPVLSLCAITLLWVTVYAATNTRLATGTLAFSELFNGPADVRMSRTVMGPGETTGWHLHPGVLTVIVTRGTLTLEHGCGGVENFSAGQAFTEHPTDIHQGVNYGSQELEYYVSAIAPAGSPGRINFDGPRCGPPTNADQCKDNGWLNFNFPRGFENQGDCVSFVKTGK